MRLIRLAALMLLSVEYLHAQLPASKPATFRASLLMLQRQSFEWQNALTRVKVEELPVGYSEGKVIEQNKTIALQNLQLVSKLSARILRSPSLNDEITLLVTVEDLMHGMQDVATLLLNTNVNDNSSVKKIGDWSKALEDLSTGAVSTFYLNTFTYVTSHASEVESKNCPIFHAERQR